MLEKLERKELEREKRERRLQGHIEDLLLDFATLNNELTTSDLQGVASVEAKKIITIIDTARLSV